MLKVAVLLKMATLPNGFRVQEMGNSATYRLLLIAPLNYLMNWFRMVEVNRH